jgi:hypothetical protein
MDDFKEIVEEATKEAYQLDKRFGQNSKVRIFANMKGHIDYLSLKDTEVMSYGYTPYTQ